MLILSPVDVEAPLAHLEGNSVPDSASKHHCAAAHVVVHDVLKGWFEGILVDKVEKDFLISCDLDPHVSLDVIDGTSDINGVILLPFPSASDFVHYDLEKQDFVRAPSD